MKRGAKLNRRRARFNRELRERCGTEGDLPDPGRLPVLFPCLPIPEETRKGFESYLEASRSEYVGDIVARVEACHIELFHTLVVILDAYDPRNLLFHGSEHAAGESREYASEAALLVLTLQWWHSVDDVYRILDLVLEHSFCSGGKGELLEGIIRPETYQASTDDLLEATARVIWNSWRVSQGKAPEEFADEIEVVRDPESHALSWVWRKGAGAHGFRADTGGT